MRGKSALLAKNFHSTFLSCEKDQEIIWRKLFVESEPYSNKLKRLLVVNTKDCLDGEQEQYRILSNMSLRDLKEKGYVRITPKLLFSDHEEVRSYILLEFDDFLPSDNSYYRNCTISFTIMCHLDEWELDDYKLRPHQIAGYIDGILNEQKLSGIGTLQFMGASQIILDENLGGIILRYIATNSPANDADNEAAINSKWPAPQQLTM